MEKNTIGGRPLNTATAPDNSVEQTTTMQVESIKDFCVGNGFTQISGGVRKNSNKYPYVTFVNAENKAENIYFSKAAATLVDTNTVINKEFATKFAIGHTINALGEARVKLVRANGEGRINVEDLF